VVEDGERRKAIGQIAGESMRDLMAAVFPGVPLRDGIGGFDTLLSIDKARRLLGYAPKHSWRDHV